MSSRSGFAWWLLVTTVVYACASAAAPPAAMRVCSWATPRAVRRTVDRALAASIVVGVVTAPWGALRAGAAGDQPPPVSVEVRSGKRLASLPSEPSSPAVVTEPPVGPIVGPTVAVPARPSEPAVVVAPGDNLWGLSAAALAIATGRDRLALDDGEIARYWLAVCNANRDALRSGNVNLIYPGEVVALPPVT